ncbi:MAG: hypothetical protein ABIH56_06310 [Candidatus Margulisiibacteriota bacterium]
MIHSTRSVSRLTTTYNNVATIATAARERLSSQLRLTSRTFGVVGALGLLNSLACGGGSDGRPTGLEIAENGIDAGSFSTFDGGRADALADVIAHPEAAAQTDAVSEEVKQDPPVGILAQSDWLYVPAEQIGKTVFVTADFTLQAPDGTPMVIPGIQNASKVVVEFVTDSTELPELYDDPMRAPNAIYPCIPGVANLALDGSGQYLISSVPADELGDLITPLYLTMFKAVSKISNNGQPVAPQESKFDIETSPNIVGTSCELPTALTSLEGGTAYAAPAVVELKPEFYTSGAMHWTGTAQFGVNTEGLSYSGYGFNVQFIVRVVE